MEADDLARNRKEDATNYLEQLINKSLYDKWYVNLTKELAENRKYEFGIISTIALVDYKFQLNIMNKLKFLIENKLNTITFVTCDNIKVVLERMYSKKYILNYLQDKQYLMEEYNLTLDNELKFSFNLEYEPYWMLIKDNENI